MFWLLHNIFLCGLCVCVFVCVQLNMTELRTFPNPPAIVTNVSAAVLVLLAPQGRIPKDRTWKAAKVVMSKVNVGAWGKRKYTR